MGTTTGLPGDVGAHRDLALERLAVRALEVAQRLGADAADAGVAVLRVDDLALALVLDVGELELLAEDGRELVERDVDLERRARPAPCPALRPSPALRPRSPPTGSPGSPSPCPAPPRCLSPKRKCGMSICGMGIETRSLPLRPMSSPCEMYLRRFCRILPADDLRGSGSGPGRSSATSTDQCSRISQRASDAARPQVKALPPAQPEAARVERLRCEQGRSETRTAAAEDQPEAEENAGDPSRNPRRS